MMVSKVGVVGAGTMGQGIAEMLAGKGLDVILIERTPEKLDQAIEQIEVSLDKQLEKWAITAVEKKIILSKIHKEAYLHRMMECDLVIESISEDLELKKQLLGQLDDVCPPHIILASNTSTLSLTELAAETKAPERVIGLHFVHPVSKIHLVEIVRALKTSDDTFTRTKRFVEETIQKRGIQVYESPGYVTTRLICVLINEAMHALSERVADAEDIDNAMRIGYDFHYGPLEMADRFGLDSVLAAMDRMFREFGDVKYRPSVLLKQMVRAGHLGTKTGQGFFSYDKDGDRL
ncbi:MULTISPECIES: 3-hydroxyacyl-CoA dehydrogenase NAD-binding domain-containing protein [unclassified Paenibacillus]|uniref:3-hydroxyacyl-CoA dehydrogenase family protein n=1 Tax=unclassified Paenibacillus TaxID=185978 RepID=UPI001AE845AD|nr:MULTISPECIES: 3-hydroxyacyl-CoA dehydrogenase NAD-binding domain-containing protein [unclassified Paenibacillus]MBP1156222.1 3-hydroxybutyryl-CoA dehydrogenase [Paenibacillus sp. PvP091]MBP1168392.1 3-hydroxybutyryl-CoA dehydrogenase [Paenibacillus sp. PvR098]MBP2439420.1 3-hydroxybutyryl-CoA dehydrogenase [Paenibacillus sp. PvP052]